MKQQNVVGNVWLRWGASIVLLAGCAMIPSFASLNPVHRPCLIENKGQWPNEVLFMSRSKGLDAWITAEGMVLDFYQVEYGTLGPEHQTPRIIAKHGHVIKLKLKGANSKVLVSNVTPLPGYYNFFIGSDPARWAGNVQRYSEVRLQNVYGNVDVQYYLDAGRLRYDFVIHPGGSPEIIQLEIEGAENAWVDPATGELVMETRFGQVRHGGLYAYQMSAAATQESVPVRFIQYGPTVFGFVVDDYDPARPLIIDPFIYATYLGGDNDDYAWGMAVNSNGEVYVTGSTLSSNFPTTTGAYDQTHNSPGNSNIGQPGLDDIFVTKINASGSALVFSTFVGGNDEEQGRDIALTSSGDIVVCGFSLSTNFPTTNNALDTSHNGSYDAVVFRLNSTGSSLLYSTYVGGSDYEDATGVALDPNDTVYVVGSTSSTDFPTTIGAYDGSLDGISDAYVIKLTPDLAASTFSTYLGGTGSDYGKDIVLDVNQQPYVTGYAELGFPTTSGAYQSTYGGNFNDAFVSKISSDGTQLLYSTYLGGDTTDYGFGIALINGKVVVVGSTLSTNFPTTAGGYDVTHNGNFDAFVTVFSTNGSNLDYSTFLGGSGWDDARAVVTDASAAYVTGRAESGFPSTTPSCDPTFNGVWDAYLAKIDPAQSSALSLVSSSFIGGSGGDVGEGVGLTSTDVYVAGWTGSNDFPATSGSYDNTANGGYDAFVVQLCAGVVPVEWVYFKAEVINNRSVKLKWATASESESYRFVIERSTDALSFTPIGEVMAAGQSTQLRTYEWTDRMPWHGWSYYRIRQEDFNGAYSYSQVQKIWIDRALVFRVYPIPANEWLIVEGDPFELISITNVTVEDVAGKTWHLKAYPSEKGFRVAVDGLPAGYYFLRLNSMSKIGDENIPFIIQR